MTDAATNQPIGIRAIATHLPTARIDNIARAAGLGFEESFIRDKVGFTELADVGPEKAGATQRLATAALEALLAKTGIARDSIDCLVVCTQNPDGHGLPNTASAIHGDMGLAQDCAAFDISLGCSGYVYGLSIVTAFMQANGLTRGVLITADPYSKVIDPADRDTAVLFGDGASATLLEPGAPWVLGRSVFGSDGTRRAAIAVADDGRLTMNGRGVFVFSAQTVPPAIRTCLERNGLALDDIDLVLAHQGSRYIVEELRRRLGLDEARLPFRAALTGNTVSSSLPLMLADELDRGPRRFLLTGFGVGLSWAVTTLTHI